MKRARKSSAWIGAVLFFFLGGAPARSDEGDVTLNSGVRLHYWQNQAEGERTILLIPGWRTSALIWKDQMQRLGQTHRVVTFDPRSQGRSSSVSAGNAPEDRADDMAALMKELKLRGVVMVGWSQGVQDVAAYVARYGTEGVSGFVLVDAAVAAGPKELEQSLAASEAILGHLAIYSAHPKEYSEGMFGAIMKTKLPRREADTLVEEAMKTPVDTGIAMLTMDIFVTDRRPSLEKFNRPALLIAASNLSLTDAREMAKRMPNAEVLEIKNAGHAAFLDQPEEFAKALLEFYATAASQRSK